MPVGKSWNSPNLVANRRYSKTVIPPTIINTLFSTPLSIVPASPGYFYIPRFIHFQKDSGAAFTLNASTRFEVKVGGVVCGYVDLVGFLDQTTQLTAYCDSPGSNISRYTAFTAANITAFTNVPITLSGTVANTSGGSGNLSIAVIFDNWPVVFGMD